MANRAIHRNPARPQGPDDRQVAYAPYNFIPLPDKVVTVALNELPDHDRYLTGNDRFTGRIHCTLETKTPLFIRGQMPLADFEKPDQEKQRQGYRDDRPDFYRDPATGRPMIPGSSLRGMLRSLVEIITFGKFGPVSERSVYYRAVADKTDIRRLYQATIADRRAGWIVKDDAGFAIQPAPEVGGRTYYKVSDKFAQDKGVKFTSIFDKHYESKGTQIVDVYFKPGTEDQVEDISPTSGLGFVAAKMICSGLMGDPKKRGAKKKHWVVPKAPMDKDAKLLRLSEQVIADYRNSITEFQQKGDLDREMGVLKNGLPVFYITDPEGQVTAIGHTANFRLPYMREKGKAMTLKAMIPEDLQREVEIDMAEALFGYVKSNNIGSGKARAYAGRVQVSDARLTETTGAPWLTPDFVLPKILSGPKPTSYQHYLTQPHPNLPEVDPQSRRKPHAVLSHYASSPKEAEPRGYKLFWHKKWAQSAADFQADPTEAEAHPKQYTRIRPVKSGVQFEFDVYFENLTQAELGALLWALRPPGEPNIPLHHKLGMGKPLGLGSVEITPKLYLDDRAARYADIWAQEGGWACPQAEAPSDFVLQAQQAFELAIMQKIGKPEKNFQEQPRIRMLQAMLAWPGPDKPFTEYMQIEHPERGNEYKDRSALPDPLHLEGMTPADPAAKLPIMSTANRADPSRDLPSKGQRQASSQPTRRRREPPPPQTTDEPSQFAKDFMEFLKKRSEELDDDETE